jgi:hypothetical protein
LDNVGCVTQHCVAAAVNEPLEATALANRSWLRFIAIYSTAE